ncbi:hypothetical protein D3C85_1100820 [compost metagenome]
MKMNQYSMCLIHQYGNSVAVGKIHNRTQVGNDAEIRRIDYKDSFGVRMTP